MRLGRHIRPDTEAQSGALALAGAMVAPTGAPMLGDVLVALGAVSAGQLAEALLTQAGSGRRLGELLVATTAITEEQLADALAEQFTLPRIDLRSRTPEPDAVALVPESVARAASILPMTLADDGALELAVSDPREGLADELARLTDRPVFLAVAGPTEVRQALDRTYKATADIGEHITAFTDVHGAYVASGATADATSDDSPVAQVASRLVTQALRDRASDIHVEPHDTGVRVRFRIDGALHSVMELPSSMGPALASRFKIMAGMNIVERRRPQDGQIAMTVDGREIDIRVATAGSIFGEKVVMRLLDKSRSLHRLADLGMPPDTAATYSELIRSPFGMVICAGPTGSGKTTTLYASMSEINLPDRNITTIEDPVEYVFPSLTQYQINERAGVTFAAGLKSILRQDPDVILVGEIRDAETARIAVQSALTGHFVLSSLHGTDAVSALYRLLDMGVEAFLVASSVRAVVGQRLVRRMCRHCRVPYRPTVDEQAFYDSLGGAWKSDWWVGGGCNLCSHTGYADRIGVYELLQITDELKEMLVAGHPSHEAMRRLAVEQGMRPMRREALTLIEHDVTTIAEIVRSIYTL